MIELNVNGKKDKYSYQKKDDGYVVNDVENAKYKTFVLQDGKVKHSIEFTKGFGINYYFNA